ncbi:MAG: hypothetical protein ABSE43_10475 [Steroidobacteraceae bacterium]
MSDPRRQLLLELYTRLVLLPAAEQPAAAALCAATSGTSIRWQGMLTEPPHESAVRIAHSLGMGPPGLQLWRASWSGDAEGTAPLPRLAMVAARLLAGREELLLLAARCGREPSPVGPGTQVAEGVLVDGNSCARMAVAGLDVETELRAGRGLALLEAAGDLLYGAGQMDAASQFLVIGLNLSVGALSALSARSSAHLLGS